MARRARKQLKPKIGAALLARIAGLQFTADDAERRVELADRRLSKWEAEQFRLEDRADTRKSKAWRSRDLAEARRAGANFDRALRDRERWATVRDNANRELRELEERLEAPPVEPPKQKKWEYVLKVAYAGSRKKKNGVWWDVRFRKRDGSRATAAELKRLLRYVKRGELPFEWERLSISWDRQPAERPGWDAEPSREARSEKEADAAFGSLGATLALGEAGKDFVFEDDQGNTVIGEEER